MKQILTISFTMLTVLVLATACQPGKGELKNSSADSKDTLTSKTVKPAESGYADINGLKMYYEVYGSGKPIVPIHGAFMTIPLNWSRMIPLLAKDRKVIVAEMQGHGRTRDIDRVMSYENMSDDVAGLLKHLKIDSADILGYSMGGGVAFQFAIRHPKQLRRLIILSGTYSNDGWWPEVVSSFADFKPELLKGTPLEKQYDSLGNDPAHFVDFVTKVSKTDAKPYDWTAEVKKIQAPIFMVIGDADGVRYEHAIELFRAKGGGKTGDLNGLPTSRPAILPGTTHVGMIQHTEWLTPMITDFLDADLNAPPPGF